MEGAQKIEVMELGCPGEWIMDMSDVSNLIPHHHLCWLLAKRQNEANS